MKLSINWRIFTILLISSLLSVLAVFPYVLTLQEDTLRQIGIPIAALILIQFVQSAILFAIAIFVGLLLAKKVNFYLPLLEALTKRKDYKQILKQIAPQSILLGFATALAIFATDRLFSLQGSAISTMQIRTPIWQTLLASFYGGITEEILMRLFLMTLLVWIGMKLSRQSQPPKTVTIISILLTAIIFGLGHLPVTAALVSITPLIILRAIILNGIGGVVFGWLYWKKGLEAAIIAHFTTDIFLLTVLPHVL